MTLAAVAKGLATFVLPPALLNRSAGRTASARYCYSVFLRHRAALASAGVAIAPRAVAEIGPGASIGVGLAALIAGAERYVGLDVKRYAAPADLLTMFDALAELFRMRACVPGADEFPTIKPALAGDEFPSQALDETHLGRALDGGRIAALRERLARRGGDSPVRYAAPWHDRAQIERQSIDWIFSQAAMEHVTDLAATYAACREWLAPGGVMSHQIDLKSHGTAKAWNGHWRYGDAAWRLVRGNRLYLINRAPASAHRDAVRAAGFELVVDAPVLRRDGLPRARLASRFRGLAESDLETAGLFLAARKV